ncbi:unnamed protein product [Tuwongella immobilis]|uniref:Uncharacterized protein n=1 Tax=Tuwongella immobilis TaxID=692036 RepID=A0A6C2YL75_9BACT|nr:unnamed protein product [Tuwongella immobilis]VTS01076.1 unnamed protein product [Tuwongella immobilis]
MNITEPMDRDLSDLELDLVVGGLNRKDEEAEECSSCS